jgi:hypothetical protein
MNYTILTTPNHTIVECLPGDGLLSSEQDALDLVAACGEAETDRLLLSESCLAPAFFDLRSGLAGVVLLKFSTYRIRAAAVVPAEVANAGRFGEMVYETNRGSQFRVYTNRVEALAWLAD